MKAGDIVRMRCDLCEGVGDRCVMKASLGRVRVDVDKPHTHEVTDEWEVMDLILSGAFAELRNLRTGGRDIRRPVRLGRVRGAAAKKRADRSKKQAAVEVYRRPKPASASGSM